MRLEGLRSEGLALLANAPAPGQEEGRVVSEIRDEGVALAFFHRDSQLPTSAPAHPGASRKRVTGGQRSWSGRVGLVLRGGTQGGCYRREKQAQK